MARFLSGVNLSVTGIAYIRLQEAEKNVSFNRTLETTVSILLILYYYFYIERTENAALCILLPPE